MPISLITSLTIRSKNLEEVFNLAVSNQLKLTFKGYRKLEGGASYWLFSKPKIGIVPT
jgi:hypothetical protein